MVCCIYPFNIDIRFQMVFQKDYNHIRYILLDERKRYNTFKADDADVDLTPRWLIFSHQGITGYRIFSAGKLIKSGVVFLHNKIILIDASGLTPRVRLIREGLIHRIEELKEEKRLCEAFFQIP